MLRRINIGCGSIKPDGWLNVDEWDWDVRYPAHTCFLGLEPHQVGEHTFETICPLVVDHFDYAVCSFMLQELNHHEIPGALENMMAILKPGGTLRILVPNIANAIYAFQHGKDDWWPQDDRTGDANAKFCTYITWFGTVRSVFTARYLLEMARPHGEPAWCVYGETLSAHEGIVELDSRPKEALIVELIKP